MKGELLESLLNGRAFAGQHIQGGVAAEFAHVQIFNPAGSGRVVVVHRIRMSGTDRALDLRSGAPAGFVAGGTLSNLTVDAGLGAPVAQLRIASNVALQGTAFLNNINASDIMDLFTRGYVVRLQPNTGLIVANNGLNADLRVLFLWSEPRGL